MPAQTFETGRAFYSENDTAPNLRRQLLDGDGEPINLGVTPDVAEVRIYIGHQSWDFYYSPYELIVDGGLCIVEDQAVADSVGWVQWEPGVGDLSPPGNYLYHFKVTYASGKVQTIPPHTYETLQIQSPVGG